MLDFWNRMRIILACNRYCLPPSGHSGYIFMPGELLEYLF